MAQGWTRAISLAELEDKGRTIFRQDGRQIALFHTERGVFACNNRCPHEGYPLREGTLDKDCKLTCNWHNWKFDLATGENQRDGDRLRVYPVELRDGEVWVEIVDPPFEDRRAKTLTDFGTAFDDHDYERLARELARLRQIGADPLDGVVAGIDLSYDRMEFGWTHAYAGTADWLTLYDEHGNDPETQLICMLESVGHMADDILREPRYPYAEGVEDWDEEAFVQAVEIEDEAKAIRMTRGALNAGLGFAEIERGLTRAALAHYNSFGHSLIYIPKAGKLIERLGERVAEPVLLSLVREIVQAFREDLIPEFRSYGVAMAEYGARTNGRAPTADDFAGLTVKKALALTAEHGTAPPLDLYRSLLEANARNMLTFDLKNQEDLDVPFGGAKGWLDVTHGLTFANAVRTQCSKFPELWPSGLMQMACFSGRNVGIADRDIDLDDWKVPDGDRFFDEAGEHLFNHHQDEYIVSVHLVKTALAVRDEVRSGEAGEGGDVALASLNRLMHEKIVRKRPRRTARQALRFIEVDI